jgi:hypothetical protein
VDVQGDKANIRGKAWPRDAAEPNDWTLEFTDPNPNREGAPALYGYAAGILEGQPGTGIYYDNVRITPNKNGKRAAAAPAGGKGVLFDKNDKK